MEFYNNRRFLIQGFLTLLLVNVVQLSTIGRHDNLIRGVEEKPDHLRSARSLARIVNGTEATLDQFPYLVSLRRTSTMSHFCGGNIIDAEWILTAAHCMFSITGRQLAASEITIVSGDLWLNQTSEDRQVIVASEIIVHENYYNATTGDDVALIRLSSNLTLTNSSAQSQVLQNSAVAGGTVCEVAGWGTPVYESWTVTNELMYVDVPIVDQDSCVALYEELVDIVDGMICAGYTEGLRDACQGDSGGGLICDGKLTGLVSYGEGCAWPNYPGVYTDVYYYRDWVLENSGIEDLALESSDDTEEDENDEDENNEDENKEDENNEDDTENGDSEDDEENEDSDVVTESGDSAGGDGNGSHTIYLSLWTNLVSFVFIGLVITSQSL